MYFDLVILTVLDLLQIEDTTIYTAVSLHHYMISLKLLTENFQGQYEINRAVVSSKGKKFKPQSRSKFIAWCIYSLKVHFYGQGI